MRNIFDVSTRWKMPSEFLRVIRWQIRLNADQVEQVDFKGKKKPATKTLYFGKEEEKTQVGDTVTFQKRRAAERRMLPVLTVTSGADMMSFCEIYPGERVMIGRDPECELTVADASVSRSHAAVRYEPLDSLFIEDLGSTNGSTVNDEPVEGRVKIKYGDRLMVGSVSLRIESKSREEIEEIRGVLRRLENARTDPLTGLLTRQYLDEVLEEQVSRLQRAHVPVSAMFLDIDHFKRVNDTLGHAAGDEVLKVVASLVLDCIRDSDHAVRYGGEEFVMILGYCDEQAAYAIAERIRRCVEAHDWAPHLNVAGTAIRADAPKSVTISLGVAEYRTTEIAAWLHQADQAMYAAKHGGRNRTIMSTMLKS